MDTLQRLENLCAELDKIKLIEKYKGKYLRRRRYGAAGSQTFCIYWLAPRSG